MKKLIFGLVLCLGMAIVAQAAPPATIMSITVENYSFEEPCTVKQMNWENVPGWSSDTPATHSGVEEDGTVGDWEGFLMIGAYPPDYPVPDPCVWQLTNHTIAAGEVITLMIDSRIGWMITDTTDDLGSTAVLNMTLYYDNGGARAVAKSVDKTLSGATKDYIKYSGIQGYYGEYTIELDVDNDCPDAIGSKIGMEFVGVSHQGPSGCWLDLDNIRLEQVLVSNPDPCDGHPAVVLTKDIEWELAAVVTDCDVYFGTDPNVIANPKVVDGQTQGKVELYDPGEMNPETDYYWRVDARVGTTVYEGDVLEFTTATTDPVIDEDPCGLTVNAGETAVFRVKATNVDSYLWKRLDGTPLSDNTGPTLTITDVQKANEDVYWCELTNTANTVYTAEVNLMTRRLVALWEFDNDLTDSEVDGRWDGFYTDPNEFNTPPTAAYDIGVNGVGQALQLAEDELHVRITDSEEFFNFYPQGYTFNIWVKTVQTGWGCAVSKQDRNDYPDVEGWLLDCHGPAHHALREVSGIDSAASVNDDEWHMVTGTYDADTGVVAVYVDGKLDAEADPSSAVASTNAYPVIFGAEFTDGYEPYEGLLDKASIYSYALSRVDVAVLYVDVMGGTICVEQLEYDLNDDCKVDILDFAEFAADWLECNIVPTCLP